MSVPPADHASAAAGRLSAAGARPLTWRIGFIRPEAGIAARAWPERVECHQQATAAAGRTLPRPAAAFDLRDPPLGLT